MKNYILKLKNIFTKNLTSLKQDAKTSQTRDMTDQQIRDIKTSKKPASDSLKCPYCLSSNFVKRGLRKKKLEQVQLFLCRTCNKTFTPHLDKGKHYPLSTLLDSLSLYHLGYSLEKTCRILNNRSPKDSTVSTTTLARWLSEFIDYCRFNRMRPYAIKKYSPKEMVAYATLAHQQLFRYRFHRAKCSLVISEDFKHRRFGPLKEFLEMVPVECPHQYFSKGLRASEAPMTFSKKQMIVRAKQNYANQLCKFVLQSVKNRRNRHDALQKFMLYNDSVTIATEVPVYLTKDDIEHMQTQLGFEMYPKPVPADVDIEVEKTGNLSRKKRLPKLSNRQRDRAPKGRTTSAPVRLPRLITGHIDILQIRNGQIHILDYKPKAEKERPIEQLTLYAMALSRLTGLRLFEFKCAWFDENDYFEFYPLHVIYKPKRKRRRRKIKTDEGTYLVNKIKEKIKRIRPI